MKQRCKIFFGLLCGLLLISVGLLANLDANRLRPLLAEWFLANKHRSLSIGNLEWQWFATPRLTARDIRISEFQQPEQMFLKIDRLDMDLALMPLLGQRLVSDQIALAGVTARLQQRDDRWNFADLLEPSSLIKDIDIARLDLSAVQLDWIAEKPVQIQLRKLHAAPIRSQTPLQLTAEGQILQTTALADWHIGATVRPGSAAKHQLSLSVTALAAPWQGSRLRADAELQLQPEGGMARALHLQVQTRYSGEWQIDAEIPELNCRSQRCQSPGGAVQISGQTQFGRGSGRLDLRAIDAGRESLRAQFSTVWSLNHAEHRANLRSAGRIAWQPTSWQVHTDELDLALVPAGLPAGLNFSLPGFAEYQASALSAKLAGRCLGSPCRFAIRHHPAAQPPWRVDGHVERLALPAWKTTTGQVSPQTPQDLLAPLAQWPLALHVRIDEWRQGAIQLRGITLDMAP